MRRAFGGTPPVGPDVHRGVLYNEMLFFDEVDEYLTEKADRGEAPDYEFFDAEYARGNPLLTPRIMCREVFDNPRSPSGTGIVPSSRRRHLRFLTRMMLRMLTL